MNIYAGPGDLVKYIGKNEDGFGKVPLTSGEIYTIKAVRIYGCHTDVELVEVGGVYNSVDFDDSRINHFRALLWRMENQGNLSWPISTSSQAYKDFQLRSR